MPLVLFLLFPNLTGWGKMLQGLSGVDYQASEPNCRPSPIPLRTYLSFEGRKMIFSEFDSMHWSLFSPIVQHCPAARERLQPGDARWNRAVEDHDHIPHQLLSIHRRSARYEGRVQTMGCSEKVLLANNGAGRRSLTASHVRCSARLPIVQGKGFLKAGSGQTGTSPLPPLLSPSIYSSG